ncbi:MAG: hypothetical protein QOI59_326 [Gammaproteobacteria bacterium]|jgi:Fic family protein|nr:hypothetical protein [Gammaproteobacteria bacterium]
MTRAASKSTLALDLWCRNESKPLLYPSLYFKQHRQQYYEELNAVRAGGDYERWIDFFAEAIRHSAEVAIETGRRVTQAFREDRAELRATPRIAGSLLMIQEVLQAMPVATVATLRDATGLTTPTINSSRPPTTCLLPDSAKSASSGSANPL